MSTAGTKTKQKRNWLTLYDCNKSRKRFSFSTTSSSSRLPWGHKQNNIYYPLPLLDERSRAGGGGWRTECPYLLSSFVRQHSELHREALQWLTQRPPGALWGGQGGKRWSIWAQCAAENSIITGTECNTVAPQLPNAFQAHYHEETQQHRGFWTVLTFVFSVQNLWILEKDFNLISIIMKYLSSLPNMRRSVAFSFERSAIFSALSRSLWKLLWMFLISSLLVENWDWMSAGRYSYRTGWTNLKMQVMFARGDCTKIFFLFHHISMWRTFAWVAILLVMNSSPVFL